MDKNESILYDVHYRILYKSDVDKIYCHCNDNFSCKDNLIKLYRFFHLPTTGVHQFRREAIENKLINSIDSIAQRGDSKIIKYELKKCLRRLFLMNESNMIYYAINEALITSIKYRKCDQEKILSVMDWKKILIIACYLVLLNKSYLEISQTNGQCLHYDDYIYVVALRNIQLELGLPKSIDNASDTLRLAFGRLEYAICSLGAIRCWSYFIDELHRNYSRSENRIICNYDNNNYFPLLYHLILKHMTCKTTLELEHYNIDWEYIKRLASWVAIITDQGDDHHTKFLLISLHDDYVKSLVKYSGVYDLHQYDTDGVLYLVEGIVDAYKDQLSREWGLTLEQIIDNIRYYIRQAEQILLHGKLIRLHRSQLKEEQKTFLNYMATSKSLNENFTVPTNWGNINDDSTWIINIDDDFFFLPTVISAWGLYDKICSQLDFPSDIGTVVEKRVAEMFEKYLQLKVHSGEFILDECKYECDGIIVEDDYAIIIECKHKSLTRQARNGDTTKVLDDIAIAYLYSQAQAYRVERAIRIADNFLNIYPHGFNISVKDIKSGRMSDKCVKLDVSNVRRCLRITCVCGNYWILSEPAIISNIESEYMSRKVEHQKEVEMFFTEQRKLLALFKDEHDKKTVRMNRLFLSFDKLWDIINTNDKKRVFDSLWRFSRISSNQNDTMNHKRTIQDIMI